MNINSSLHLQTLYKWGNVRPHQLFLSACRRKTYYSAALISSPRAAFFLLHHAHQHAHRPLGAQSFGILQVSIGYCFYHSAHHLRFMAFVLVYEPYFPAASIRVHRQSSFRIFHKGDRFPKAAVRTLVRNRSRFSGGSSV